MTGGKLEPGDLLKCDSVSAAPCLRLAEADRPRYATHVQLRVVPGYQDHSFTRLQQRRFFSGIYTVTDRADRMGYRLQGPVIECALEGILSEGICHGAIQIPADGQPIVLLNDRQTIGGYPKIGSALSLDTAKLAQLMPGSTVGFEPISPYAAHNALHLAASRFLRCTPETCDK
jgi:allophanate hydrolase subunit 2